jgi:hypothetical protein
LFPSFEKVTDKISAKAVCLSICIEQRVWEVLTPDSEMLLIFKGLPMMSANGYDMTAYFGIVRRGRQRYQVDLLSTKTSRNNNRLN